MPKGLEVFREAGGLTIERSWFTWSILPLAFFTLLWDGFMVLWYTIALSTGEMGMAAFGTLHALIGLGLLYAVLSTVFNVTTVEVRGGKIRASHGPFPARGQADEVDARDVDQVFCRRRVRQGDGNYEIHVLKSDGTRMLLVDGIPEPAQALYIEQEVEDLLGIEDRPVHGEHAPARIQVRVNPQRELPGERAGDDELEVSGVDLGGPGTCPVCGEEVVGEVKLCPFCATTHHPDCWRYGGGCATYGCDGRR